MAWRWRLACGTTWRRWSRAHSWSPSVGAVRSDSVLMPCPERLPRSALNSSRGAGVRDEHLPSSRAGPRRVLESRRLLEGLSVRHPATDHLEGAMLFSGPQVFDEPDRAHATLRVL